MDVGSSILHHAERHLNACLTCLVLRSGTHGYHVTTKKCLGIVGFSPEVHQTLFNRMKKHKKALLTGNACCEIDPTLYDFNSDNFDLQQLPQWLLIIITEKELSQPESIGAVCRWYRRFKAWRCDCLTVVTAMTTPPCQTPPPPLSNRIHDLCASNPELEELRARNRLKSFYISHWDCIENSEQVFVNLVHSWLAGSADSGDAPSEVTEEQHMTYRNIAKILLRDMNQSLPQIDIFLRLTIMCILGLFSVFLTLGIIVFISKDGGLNYDMRRAREYLVGHLQSRRTPKMEWGRTHTPTILTALQINNHHWCFDSTDNSRSVDRMEIGILSSLARLSPRSRGTSAYTPWRLAGDITGLLATFQNPRDFHDHDLVAMLMRYVTNVIPYTAYTAHAYSSYVIALCNNGEDLDHRHADKLYQKQNKDGGFSLGITEAARVMMALSCLERTERLLSAAESIARYIRHQRRNDGSYGSLYATALVLQAYNITGVAIDSATRKEASLSWLASRCYGNTELKDPEVASAVLLALSGGSVLDISKIIGVDHKKHRSTAAPSADQLAKYKYLSPEIPQVSQVSRDLPHVAENVVNSALDAADSDTAMEIEDTSVSITNISPSVDLNKYKVYSRLNKDCTESNICEHRWKKWKHRFVEDIYDYDPGSGSLEETNKKLSRRRRKYGSTFNELNPDYLFLSKCTL